MNGYNSNNKKKIVVAGTGASGIPILIECLKLIKEDVNFESFLILSDSAKITIKQETSLTVKQVYELADNIYGIDEIGAKPASGTFENDGMLIVPCSMKTLAGINSGYTDNLILRSADVSIKEKRKLVLAARETPLSPIHLRNIYELSRIQNVYIIPPMMTFYHNPKSIEEMIHHIACKLVAPFGVETQNYKRWEGIL